MSQFNILIIDDNHDLADGLGEVLEDEGYQVVIAYDGDDGIKAIEARQFDAAFIDIGLPDMNGVELIQKIHNKDPGCRTTMITGHRVERLLADAVDKGDVGILHKPFQIGAVLEILSKI